MEINSQKNLIQSSKILCFTKSKRFSNQTKATSRDCKSASSLNSLDFDNKFSIVYEKNLMIADLKQEIIELKQCIMDQQNFIQQDIKQIKQDMKIIEKKILHQKLSNGAITENQNAKLIYFNTGNNKYKRKTQGGISKIRIPQYDPQRKKQNRKKKSKYHELTKRLKSLDKEIEVKKEKLNHLTKINR